MGITECMSHGAREWCFCGGGRMHFWFNRKGGGFVAMETFFARAASAIFHGAYIAANGRVPSFFQICFAAARGGIFALAVLGQWNGFASPDGSRRTPGFFWCVTLMHAGCLTGSGLARRSPARGGQAFVVPRLSATRPSGAASLVPARPRLLPRERRGFQGGSVGRPPMIDVPPYFSAAIVSALFWCILLGRCGGREARRGSGHPAVRSVDSLDRADGPRR